jgi:hypothetical protein
MSVHFLPTKLSASTEPELAIPYLERQPPRDPTWVAILAFAFICAFLLIWNATKGADARELVASLNDLEEGQVIEAGHAPDGTILWAKKIDGRLIYFPSATITQN